MSSSSRTHSRLIWSTGPFMYHDRRSVRKLASIETFNFFICSVSRVVWTRMRGSRSFFPSRPTLGGVEYLDRAV